MIEATIWKIWTWSGILSENDPFGHNHQYNKYIKDNATRPVIWLL